MGEAVKVVRPGITLTPKEKDLIASYRRDLPTYALEWTDTKGKKQKPKIGPVALAALKHLLDTIEQGVKTGQIAKGELNQALAQYQNILATCISISGKIQRVKAGDRSSTTLKKSLQTEYNSWLKKINGFNLIKFDKLKELQTSFSELDVQRRLDH